MSLVHLSNFCAHIKNCKNVNIAITSVPYFRLHIQIAFQLYKHGFLSTIQRGSTIGPDTKITEVTTQNISTRRLWLRLKYRENKPIIRDLSMISKPGRKVNLSIEEVKALASGLKVRFISPLQPAENIFIRTDDRSIYEIQDAARLNLPGMPLCRVK